MMMLKISRHTLRHLAKDQRLMISLTLPWLAAGRLDIGNGLTRSPLITTPVLLQRVASTSALLDSSPRSGTSELESACFSWRTAKT